MIDWEQEPRDPSLSIVTHEITIPDQRAGTQKSNGCGANQVSSKGISRMRTRKVHSPIRETSQIYHKINMGGKTHSVHERAHPSRKFLRALVL
jgi:hypothetical protein